MRHWFLAAIALAAAVLASCGRAPAPPAEPASHEEAMKLASSKWELNRWSEVFAACDAAFRYADRAGGDGAITAVDCAAESALRMGKPELALPHYARLFEAWPERLRTASGRQRLANNYGVLLIERGRRAEGIARLEWAMEAYAGTSYGITGYGSFPARTMIVKNLARAYYDTAGDPAIRAWVREQGEMLRSHMEGGTRGAHLGMGASSALHALVVIGRRQANTDTPAWEEKVREWEPVEAEIAARHPNLAQVCESIPLRTTMMETCMRELAPPP
jgi:tetratricopeptide (TPR) repeat protein